MTLQEHRLADERVGRLLFNLSAPATVGMFVMALYNLVDTIFVGRGVGALAIAGISIVFPVQMIIMALAQMIGIGGASLISRSLGARDLPRANRTFGTMLVSMVILSVAMAVAGNVFIDQLMAVFGASAAILPFAREYAQIILSGALFGALAMVGNNILRADGRATIAMTTMLISAIANMILDPIFIFGLDMGVRGAALATVLAQILTVVYQACYLFSGRSSLRLRWADLRLDRPVLFEIVAVGSASFVRQVSGSVLAVVMNHTVRIYGGDLAIAIFGILHRLLMFVAMPLFGIAQGLQPVAGFNYGAGRWDKTRRVLRLANIWSTVVATAGALILISFPASLFGLFTHEADLIHDGVAAIRIVALSLPLVGFLIVGATLFQAIGKPREALILSVARQLALIVLALILPRFLQLRGVWLAFPLSDSILFGITWALFRTQWREFSYPPRFVCTEEI